MAITPSSITSIISIFLYLGAGYTSLLIGYYISGDKGNLEDFYDLSGTDKTIQTFLFGAVAILWAIKLGNAPSTINVDNVSSFLKPILQAMVPLIVFTAVLRDRHN